MQYIPWNILGSLVQDWGNSIANALHATLSHQVVAVLIVFAKMPYYVL